MLNHSGEAHRRRMASVKEEMKRFLQTTSVKGLPRIMRNQTKLLRTIWIVAVLAFFMVAMYQTVMLFIQYFRYETSTIVSEKILEFPSAPDVIICNMKPVSSLRNQTNNQTATLHDFNAYLNTIATCNNCSAEELKVRTHLVNKLSSPAGYYQYIGKEGAISVSHSLEDIFVDCRIEFIDGMLTSRYPCNSSVNITRHVSMTHFNCYKIQPRTPAALGWSIISFVDNFQTDVLGQFSAHEAGETHAGLDVSLVEAGTLWSGIKGQIWLAPGTSNNIQFLLQKRENLPPPYGYCRNPGYEGEKYKMPYKKTMTSCISLCLETEVVNKCSCKDPISLAMLDELGRKEELPYCASSSQPIEQMIKNLQCANSVRMPSFSLCAEECDLPCTRKLYTHTISNIPWPSEQNLNYFYKNFIQGRRYESLFRSAWEEANRPNGSNANLLNLVKRNFVHFSIFPLDHTFLHLRDQPKLELVNLSSQLGGALNLWSGITLIVAIEVIELFVRLCSKDSGSSRSTVVDVKKPHFQNNQKQKFGFTETPH